MTSVLERRLALALPVLGRLQLHQIAEPVSNSKSIRSSARGSSQCRFRRRHAQVRIRSTPAPIIRARIWISPIWNADTPVNIAARAPARGHLSRRGGSSGSMKVQRKPTSLTTCHRRLPQRGATSAPCPRSMKLRPLQPIFAQRSTLRDRRVDVAIRIQRGRYAGPGVLQKSTTVVYRSATPHRRRQVVHLGACRARRDHLASTPFHGPCPWRAVWVADPANVLDAVENNPVSAMISTRLF